MRKIREYSKQPMQASEEKVVLKLDNIIISPDGLSEVDGSRVPLLFVPCAGIKHIVLKFGRSEHRPVVSLAIGITLSAAGLVILAFFSHPFKGWRSMVGIIGFEVLGASLVFDALKKRHFLEVHHENRITRLVFSGKVRSQDVKAFCEKVRSIYGYKIIEGVHPEAR